MKSGAAAEPGARCGTVGGSRYIMPSALGSQVDSAGQ